MTTFPNRQNQALSLLLALYLLFHSFCAGLPMIASHWCLIYHIIAPMNTIQRKHERHELSTPTYTHSAYSMNHLIDNSDFGFINHGTIVDVGGSHCLVRSALQECKNTNASSKFSPTQSLGLTPSQLPETLKTHISSIYRTRLSDTTPRQRKPTFTCCVHDWSDKY